MKFYEFIDELLNKLGISAGQLAREIDYDPTTVQKWIEKKKMYVPQGGASRALIKFLRQKGLENELEQLNEIISLAEKKDEEIKSVKEREEDCLKKYLDVNREILPECLWKDYDVKCLTVWFGFVDMAYFFELSNTSGNKSDAYNRVIGASNSLDKKRYIMTQDYYAFYLKQYGIDVEEMTNEYGLFFSDYPSSLRDIPDRYLCRMFLNRLSFEIGYPGGGINAENLLLWLETLKKHSARTEKDTLGQPMKKYRCGQLEDYAFRFLANLLKTKKIIEVNQAIPFDALMKYVFYEVACDDSIVFFLTENGTELVEYWKGVKKYAR